MLPVQVALARRFDPTLPIGGTVSGSAVVNGTTRTRLTARADVIHDDVTGRSHVIGTVAYAPGHPPLINAALRLAPLSLATVGRFAPAAGLTGTVRGPVSVRGPMRALAIRAALTTPDGGSVGARGTVDLASVRKGYDVTATANLFDARSVTTKAPHTSVTADATVAGRGTTLATLDARGAMHLLASQYDSVAVDSATVRFAAASGVLTLDTLALRLPGGGADAGGSVGLVPGRTGTLRYAVAIDSLGRLARLIPARDTGSVPPRPGVLSGRLARQRSDSARIANATAVERAVTGRRLTQIPVDTPRAIPRSTLAGSIRASGTLTGNIQSFGTTGTAAATNLVAYGSSARSLAASYSWENARTPASRVAARVNAIGVDAAGFFLDTVTARASYQKPNGTVVLAVRQDSQRVYAAAARFILNKSQNTLLLDRMRLRFDTTMYASAHPSAIRWGPAGVNVDSLLLQTPQGRGIFVDGRIPTNGTANLHLVLTQLQVANLLALAQSDIPAQGLVSADLRATGTRAAPTLRGAFGLERFSYAGRATPEVHGTLSYAAQTLTASLNASREGGPPLLFAHGTVPINLALASIAGPRIPPARQIDATITSDSLPLDLLPQISTAVTNFGGRAYAHFTVRGTMQHPNVQGRVALWGARARIIPLGITPSDIAGNIRLAGDTVIVDSLVARSGGTVRLTGGIGLAHSLTAPRFALHFVARNARIMDTNQYGNLHASADLVMSGPFNDAAITGSARVLRGVLYIPTSSGKTLVGAGDPALFSVLDTAVAANRALFPAQSPFLANLSINIALAVNRDVFVRSTEANVEVYTEGALRISADRETQSLVLDGVLLSDRGEYRFESRRFRIVRGSATFVNAPGLNPTLQVTAQYPVLLPGREAFNIQIIISGTLDHPKIALQSDAQPPISQTNLLSYLAFGQSSTSLLQQEGNGLTTGGTGSGNLVGQGAAFAAKQVSAAALGALTDQFAGQAARSLGADVFDISPADVSLDAGSFLRGTKVEFGKYIQNRTFLSLNLRPDPTSLQRPGFTLTHRFPGGAGYQIQASLAPRYLLTQPTLSPTQQPVTTSAFGLFLVREWRY